MSGTPPWPHPESPLGPATPAPDHIDVAVIGGGLTGLALARAVSAAGGDVAVFEMDHIGSGSTRHSLGVLTAHYPGGPSAVMRRVGGGKATALWLAADAALRDIPGLVDTEPVAIETRPTRRNPAERLARDAAWLQERNFEATYRAEDSTLLTTGAVVDPLELALAFGDAVEKEGGTLAQGVTVTSLSRHTTGYQVLSTAGKTTANAVIVATGARHSQRGVHAPGPIVLAADRYGVIVQTEEPVVAATPVIRTGALTVRRLSPTSFMIAGHVGLSSGLGADQGAQRLVDVALTKLPELGQMRIAHSWVAPVGLTADGIPHVWRTDGIWFAGGYNGDAPVAAVAVGTELGDVLSGARTQTIFAGVTPPRRPRRSGRMGAALERILDR